MKISIALTTWNGERYLSKQLESFSAQTRKPDQLVICDDGSSDRTVEICRSYADKAPFAVEIYENLISLGASKNFVKAFSYCDGDIVFLSDQDDVWYPQKIETVVDAFRCNPEAHLIIHDLEYCDSMLNRIGQRKIDRVESFSNTTVKYNTGMATAITGSFLKLCMPIPGTYHGGHDNWIHACARALDVKVVIPDVLADYRRHETNVTGGRMLNVPRKTTGDDFIRKRRKNRWARRSAEKIEREADDLEARANWITSFLERDATTQESKRQHLEKQQICFLGRARNIRHRLEILSLGRLFRIMPVARALTAGVYRDWNGLVTAAKDILLN